MRAMTREQRNSVFSPPLARDTLTASCDDLFFRLDGISDQDRVSVIAVVLARGR